MLISKAAIQIESVRYCFLVLEWSMHGAIWFIISALLLAVALAFDFAEDVTYKSAILFLGICIDLIVVGAIKITSRRRRPIVDIADQIYEAPIVDRYSFPSGHSSRAAMLAVFGCMIYRLPYSIKLLLNIFVSTLAMSRVAMGRHYLGDVVAGILLGYIEGHMMLKMPASMIKKFITY